MNQQLYRLEIVPPKQGYDFLKLENFSFTESEPKGFEKTLIRIKEGHSFLTGFNNVILFDGVIKLELRFIEEMGYILKPKPEFLNNFIERLRQLLPEQLVLWNSSEKAVEMNLMKDTTISVAQSSEHFLAKIAEEFQIDSSSLVAQASWELVTY